MHLVSLEDGQALAAAGLLGEFLPLFLPLLNGGFSKALLSSLSLLVLSFSLQGLQGLYPDTSQISTS